MKVYLKKTGFTLVEIMVATTLGTFIAVISIGVLRAVTAGAQMVEANIEAAAEIRFAVKTVRNDLINMYKPGSKADTKFIAFADESGVVANSYLIFYTVSRTKARAFEPEGEIYEVEYSLIVDEDKSTLMRRFWPNPDEDREPGGILSVIAEDIEVFQARFFDGTEWSTEWPEEMDSLPFLIELTIVAKQEGSRRPAVETLYINLIRSAGTMLEEAGAAEESG